MQDEFNEDFLHLLNELNECVAQAGEPVAGNYIYTHNDPSFPNAAFDPAMVKKRRNLVHSVHNKSYRQLVSLYTKLHSQIH